MALYLRACEDDLARNEDEEHDLGLDHPVDETREELGGERRSLACAWVPPPSQHD